MAKVTDKHAQMRPWLNRLFPPSSPFITQPGQIEETILPVIPALPPSLLMERAAIEIVTTVNPGTFITFPAGGVPRGRFLWVHCVTWEPAVAVQTAQGRAFISIRAFGIAGTEVHMAMGHFDQSSLLCPLSSFCGQQGSGVTIPQLGSGGGSFLIPQGMELHCSTAGTPAPTTVYRAKILYTACDIGELSPSNS